MEEEEKNPPVRHVCERCGSSRIEFKAHVAPNERYKLTWLADDPDDVWCEQCQTWGRGSRPWQPCSQGCSGFAAFQVNRRPREGLEYVAVAPEGSTTLLEIQACEDCARFTGPERDYQAYTLWVREGRLDLHAPAPAPSVPAEHELILQYGNWLYKHVQLVHGRSEHPRSLWQDDCVVAETATACAKHFKDFALLYDDNHWLWGLARETLKRVLINASL